MNHKFNLLKAVHKYYPVGLPYSRNSYEGFLELRDIMARKINDIIENIINENWEYVIKDLHRKFPHLVLLDTSYQQTPSLSFEAKTDSQYNNVTHRPGTLKVAMSLLTEYYTIYVEEDTSGAYTNIKNSNILPALYKDSFSDEENAIITAVKNIMLIYYPSYQYIEHRFLNDIFVDGVIPVSEDPESLITSYRLFDLIF